MGKDGDATPVRLRATVKVSNKPAPGVQRGGPEPEAHFLLRLPEDVAEQVREALATKSLDDVDFSFAGACAANRSWHR